MSEVDLKCTRFAATNSRGGPSRIPDDFACDLFTVGKTYTATLTGHESTLLQVEDNEGHSRIMLRDNLRFCVLNDTLTIGVGPRPDVMVYAHFELCDDAAETIATVEKAIAEKRAIKKWFHTVPFSGSWHVLDDQGRVGFTHSLYEIAIREGRNLTLDEYKAEHPNEQYSEPMNDDELDAFMAKWETEQYTGKPATVIDKDRYWEMLEVLPPCRFGTSHGLEMFYVSEAQTSTIHSWFATDGTTYVEMYDHRHATTETIAKRFGEARDAA